VCRIVILLLVVASRTHADGTPQDAICDTSSPHLIPENFNEKMMEATFLISGPTSAGATSIGTGFILGRPIRNHPDRSRIVLVTAAHVFGEIATDEATLTLHVSPGSGWSVVPQTIRIREAGLPIWTQHASSDVAAMMIALPSGAMLGGNTAIPMSALGGAAFYEQLGLHAGDEVSCLGYPLGASGPYTFPLLRSGRIAQYPISAQDQTLLIDFHVHGGNSGGPCFISGSMREKGGGVMAGSYAAILGLVSQQATALDPSLGQRVSLELAVAASARAIRETVEQVPEP
jgi:S1-C subfamily serine protease